MSKKKLPKDAVTTEIEYQVQKLNLRKSECSKILHKPLSIFTKPIEPKTKNEIFNPCKIFDVTNGSKSIKINDACKPRKQDHEDSHLSRVKRPLYNMQPWAPSRLGKKLLVLDLDQTVCDFGPNSSGKPRPDERRPYLTIFLSSVYEYYDIVIWSATEKLVILEKIHRLQLFSEFSKLLFCLDLDVMLKIKVRVKNKLKDATVKPLETVWNKAPRYCSKNTLMIDDRAINFIINPKNGLQIQAYCRNNFKKDNELIFLSKYLINLAIYCTDFATINHKNWKSYKPK